MRHFRITLFTAMALLAIVPASALARGHERRSHRHPVRHARIERFGHVNATSPSSSDNVGRIQSLTGGVLTIALSDGSTVSGAVSGDTEVECMAQMQDDISRDGSGDHRGSGNDHQGGGDQGDDGGSDSTGDGAQGENNCSMADLAPGATVREAELRISGAGRIWRKIELGA
jgi:hypothetical protein